MHRKTLESQRSRKSAAAKLRPSICLRSSQGRDVSTSNEKSRPTAILVSGEPIAQTSIQDIQEQNRRSDPLHSRSPRATQKLNRILQVCETNKCRDTTLLEFRHKVSRCFVGSSLGECLQSLPKPRNVLLKEIPRNISSSTCELKIGTGPGQALSLPWSFESLRVTRNQQLSAV